MKNYIGLSQAIKAVDDEEEYPGEMPPEMRGYIEKAMHHLDLDLLQKALRITVRLTKKGIRDRIMSYAMEE